MRRALTSWLVLPIYIVTSLLFTWPLITRFTTAIPSSGAIFDPPFQAFLLGWNWQALATEPLRLFDAPIFHPEPRTLTYMDPMLGEALLGAPVYTATRSIPATYNFLVLFSFATSAWATYRLVRLFQVPRAGAFLSGFLFAFSPYRVANLDLLNQLQTQFLPLGLFLAIRYVRRGRLRDAAGIFATVAVQVTFGWYYALFLALVLVLFFAYALWFRAWRPPAGHGRPLAVLSLIAIVPTVLLSWPYIAQRLAMPEFHRTLGQAALYSADVLDYLQWSPESVLARWISLPQGAASYWPGLVTIVLAAVGLRRSWPGRTSDVAGFFPLLAVAGFILSLGPVLHVAGHRIIVPLPYAALYFGFPGFASLRAPARLAVVTLLAIVVIAGIGYRQLHRRRVPRIVWLLPLLAIAALCAWTRPLHLLTLPTAATMPPVYHWLARQPRPSPVLEFPVPATDSAEDDAHALRQLLVLYHGQPRLDGCSGFVSKRYRAFRTDVQSFPDDHALDVAARAGARYVIVHYKDYDPALARKLAQRVAAQPRLIPRARFADDAAYELRASS